MPAFDVSRSITINAPLETVNQSLVDFKQWPIWSPWLIMERDTELTYSDDQGQVGASYDWKGDLVGQGGMELVSIDYEQLEMQLNFIKPFKSKARVLFDFEELSSDETKVTWSMFSKMPFFLFFMVSKMKVLIGMDYDRGLRMLKEFIEENKVSSSISIDGINTIESQKYIGFKRKCTFDEIGEMMSKDFTDLSNILEEKGLLANDTVPYTIYNVFDIFTGNVEYITAFPISGHINASDIEAPYFIGKLDNQEVLKVTHKGKYEHLGNAWSTAMNYSQNKKIKTLKTPVGMEYYLNDPMSTPAEELITEVVLPLR